MLPSSAQSAEYSLGGWCGLPSAYATELMAAAGFDWLLIDWQHGMLDYSDVIAMLQAAAISQTPALVRVPSAEPAWIMKALDAGAAGIVVPLVNTAEQARQAVQACRYPPAGSRSWGPARAQLWTSDYTVQGVNKSVTCAVQIETMESVDNLDEILAVEGVDIAFVGPSDLAVSMGETVRLGPIPGSHQDTIAEIGRRARDQGVVPGIFCGSSSAAISFADLGYRMLAVATDALLLRVGSTAALREVRDSAARRPPAPASPPQ
jgi:4-hydroxy-2-oxoheptanedioate aldolase